MLDDELGGRLVAFDRLEFHARAICGLDGHEVTTLTQRLLGLLQAKLRSTGSDNVWVFASEADARVRLLEAIWHVARVDDVGSGNVVALAMQQ